MLGRNLNSGHFNDLIVGTQSDVSTIRMLTAFAVIFNMLYFMETFP